MISCCTKVESSLLQIDPLCGGKPKLEPEPKLEPKLETELEPACLKYLKKYHSEYLDMVLWKFENWMKQRSGLMFLLMNPKIMVKILRWD